MANDDALPPRSIAIPAARKIATTTKGAPTLLELSPRWFCRLLPWVGVRAGTYRINKGRIVVHGGGDQAVVLGPTDAAPALPTMHVDYTTEPREHSLSMLQSVIKLDVRVKEVFCEPMDQQAQQLRLAVIGLKERKERELIVNPDFGVLPSVAPSMRVAPRGGPPTPDDMDELLARVWKKPAFFLAHPRAIAAFGRECTSRGVPPATVQIDGCPFLTWRGVPLVPSDKLPVDDRSAAGGPALASDILLMRVGEAEQGVVGLRDGAMHNEHGHSVSVRCMGIDGRGLTDHLITLYFSLAVLADDAVGVLENVDIGAYA